MKTLSKTLAPLALLFLTGCALTPQQASCLFGGATEAEDAICARVNFGVEGELYAANGKTGGDCKDHVVAVAKRLGGRYATEAVVSCPAFLPECHASALVRTPEGAFVLDNGALGYPGDVMTEGEFHAWMRGAAYTVVTVRELSTPNAFVALGR